MMYRNRIEVIWPEIRPEFRVLLSWLRGETGNESLKAWLNTLPN